MPPHYAPQGVVGWVTSNHDIVIAVTTVCLAVFGALQVLLEIARRADARRAARIHLAGPAWLARRSLEAALRSAIGQKSAPEWSSAVRAANHLDPLERHMLEAVKLASFAGGKDAANARKAFEEFLAFADNVNYIGTVRPSIPDTEGFPVFFTTVQRDDLNRAARAAVSHLRAAGEALAAIAPRRPHEPSLPADYEIPLLSGSPDPYRLSANS